LLLVRGTAVFVLTHGAGMSGLLHGISVLSRIVMGGPDGFGELRRAFPAGVKTSPQTRASAFRYLTELLLEPLQHDIGVLF